MADQVPPSPPEIASPSFAGLSLKGWPGPAVLLIFAALLFFTRLGSPLQEPDEARYAEIPRQMLADNHWLVPVLNGQPYLDKPPLLYWLVMISYRTFGVDDWSARLVPAVAGFLTVLLAYLWGRRTTGPRAGLAGAAVLCLAARFVYLGRLLTMDGLLGLWVTAALAAEHVALLGRERRLSWGWWLVSALACGLGVLTKGPVALALVLPPLLAFVLLDRRNARPGWGGWAIYLLGGVGVAAPWFIAVMVCRPEFAGYFFWTHNVVRFVAPFAHAKPVWFHLPGVLVGMLPWTLLLPGLLLWLFRRPSTQTSPRPAALGLFLLAATWGLLFFSLAGCKRAAYVLPVLPPLALALGCYLESVLLNRPAGHWRRAWLACGVGTFLVLFAGVQMVLPKYARKFSLRGQVRPHAGWCADERVPVISYPRQWDSVGFYLRRSDVTTFRADQMDELLARLRSQPETVLVAKSGPDLNQVLAALPPSLEFSPGGHGGTVTVGLVRRRTNPPGSAWAVVGRPAVSSR